MKFDIMCKNSDTLKRLKEKLFKEIEMAFSLNLKLFMDVDELVFLMKKTRIPIEWEDLPLKKMNEEMVCFNNIIKS